MVDHLDAPEAPAHRNWIQLAAPVAPDTDIRIGLIALANDPAIEPDVTAFLNTEGVSVQTQRVPSPLHSNLRSLNAVGKDIAESLGGLMPDDRLDVVAFGCTSATMALGEDLVRDQIHAVKPGLPATNPISAALRGLDLLKCRRIALLTPYIGEVNHMVQDYLASKGVILVRTGFFNLADDGERSRVRAEAYDMAADALALDEGVDALFISCTALRTCSVVERLEQRIGKPVVTSNQALAWDALRKAGHTAPLAGRGRLMHL